MKLVVLGSGTSVPHPQRASSGFWLETAGGSLLLDASAAAVHRVAQERLDWVNLDAIWISHFHLDHVGGLAPLLFGTKYAPETQARRKLLTIYGPHGLKKLLTAFDQANDYDLLKQPFPIEVREVAPKETFNIFPELRAETLSTPHTSESLALRLQEQNGGASLVYTSDTGYTEALAAFARGVDLLLMECSFPHSKPVESHLDLRDAMRLAELAAPRRVILTHLYPQWDGIDVAAEARKLWPGETIEARDGMVVAIDFKKNNLTGLTGLTRAIRKQLLKTTHLSVLYHVHPVNPVHFFFLNAISAVSNQPSAKQRPSSKN